MAKSGNKKKFLSGTTFNILITVFGIIFFLSVIIAYYSMLYSETEKNFVKDGELNAVEASSRINKYLSTGIDIINLTAYTLDDMLRSGSSSAEILSYLESQSFAANVFADQSTGVYGYINGEYLDGSGWEPDPDYSPTQRPWYKEAMARRGKVVVVDPYLDVMTGTMVVTLAKQLGDAKSVVSFDISLGQLQTITEEIAGQKKTAKEVVLDGNYHVIASSDRNGVGTNYLKGDDLFGRSIAEQLKKSNEDESHFSIKYDGSEYLVYVMKVENNWLCLSIINASDAYYRLRVSLVVTIVISVVIIAAFIFYLFHSNKKDAFAEEMRELSELQTKYAYSDQMTGLKNRRAYAETISRLENDLPKDCCVIMIDVNGLKTINDTYGHKAGDELIIAAADGIRAAFKGEDLIFRIGGDEYCVIMDDNDGKAEEGLSRLEKIAAEWKGKYTSGFSVSYGIGKNNGRCGIDSIWKEADRKMYEYKENFYKERGIERRAF